jgi:hypothetical protein
VDGQIGDHKQNDNDSKDNDEGGEEDDEDDGEDGNDDVEAKKLFALNVTGAGLFREWLKSVVQWARALRELSSRKGVGSLIRSRNLQFKLVDNPRSLASVQFPLLSLSAVVSAIVRNRSLTLYSNIPSAKERVQQIESVLKKASRDTFGQQCMEAMPVPMYNDKIHCESLLASQQLPEPHTVRGRFSAACHSDPTSSQSIGVTKLCCYLCHLYLQKRGHQHTGTHGRIMPWIPPPGIELTDLAYLLEKTQQKLITFLNSVVGQDTSLGPRDSPVSGTSSESDIILQSMTAASTANVDRHVQREMSELVAEMQATLEALAKK